VGHDLAAPNLKDVHAGSFQVAGMDTPGSTNGPVGVPLNLDSTTSQSPDSTVLVIFIWYPGKGLNPPGMRIELPLCP
jgi:hypothetical protein